MEIRDLTTRHHKETLDLTARIAQKKRNATKKTRRGINSECESLERELKERQAQEVAALGNPEGESTEQTEILEEGERAEEPDTTTPNTPRETQTPPPQQSPTTPARKPNRMKARLARRAAEAAALRAAAEAEASAHPNPREAELSSMQSLLINLHLSEKEIVPDGHCLYSAFADQLPVPSDYKYARRKCAEHMLAHREEFEPFLEEPFEEHVRKVAETAEWGGQTEALALARAFGVAVNVVQAEGRGVERMNEEGKGGGEVWLGYYRHRFGLGEHYNSLRKIKVEGS